MALEDDASLAAAVAADDGGDARSFETSLEVDAADACAVAVVASVFVAAQAQAVDGDALATATVVADDDADVVEHGAADAFASSFADDEPSASAADAAACSDGQHSGAALYCLRSDAVAAAV